MAWSDEDLRRIVEVLAADPERQVEWVRDDGTYPLLDEIALDFSYELDRVRQHAHATAAGKALLALDRQLTQMSGQADKQLWLSDALMGPEWTKVRALASSALRLLKLT